MLNDQIAGRVQEQTINLAAAKQQTPKSMNISDHTADEKVQEFLK